VNAPEQLLTVKDVSRLLGVSDRCIWSVTSPRGALASVRIGRLVRYLPQDVETYIQTMRVEPRA